jgi:glucosamine-6-phosphate deaminase
MPLDKDASLIHPESPKLHIHISPSPAEALGTLAEACADEIRRSIKDTGRTIGLFDFTPAIGPFYAALISQPEIEWTRVLALSPREVLGLDENAPGSFRKGLIDHLIGRVPIVEFHGIRGEARNPAAMRLNFEETLQARKPDFAVLAVGSDGSLAFNTPANCVFDEPSMLKLVAIAESGPNAATLNIPALMACPRIFAIALGEQIAESIRRVAQGEPTPSCPASILQTHSNASLFLDAGAARFL